MRFAFILMALCGFTIAAHAQEFSPKQRQGEIGPLRDFIYPPGYSEGAIVDLENGRVPTDMTVSEFARLHCGESRTIVFTPCVVRSRDKDGFDYFVVVHGGNMHFRDVMAATQYFDDRVSENVRLYGEEVAALNDYVDDFCAQIANGGKAADILKAKGTRPRLAHAVAPPDPDAKFPFSNLFQWEKCRDCVGIVAIAQRPEVQPAVCGNVRKVASPQVAFFVVDRESSKGHGALDEAVVEFSQKAAR